MLQDNFFSRAQFMTKLSAFVVLLLAVIAVAVGTATSAKADPGFCGVRVSGPNNGDSIQGILYTMRNQCARSYKFKLHFPRTGRYSGCQSVGAYDYGHFQVIYADPDWQIKLC